MAYLQLNQESQAYTLNTQKFDLILMILLAVSISALGGYFEKAKAIRGMIFVHSSEMVYFSEGLLQEVSKLVSFISTAKLTLILT